MHGISIPLILIVITAQLLDAATQCNAGQGDACIFLGKVDGWQKYEERDSYNLIKPVASDSWKLPNATIYLTMASFRDKLCPKTLFNLYSKALHPERITVGVVQQNIPADIDCYYEYCRLINDYFNNTDSSKCPYEDNIKMDRVDAALARGPTWARARGSLMLGNEEFCMQTDSHMDFVPHWDVYMLEMWAATRNEYAVLSTYVADSATLENNLPGKKGTNNIFEVPHLCMLRFHGGHGMPRNWGTKCVRAMARPKLTNMLWGAGLSFSKCHAERKVPYDPHTPHIFDGEEFSRALRFWTWGYDIYTPHRVYVVHHYRASQSDPVHMSWGSNGISMQQRRNETEASVKRLRRLFGMKGDPISIDQLKAEIHAVRTDKHGLGDRRTVQQAIAFSGIDFENKEILGNYCGNLDFIPFTEHPWGADYVPRYDPITEAFADVRDPGSIYFDAATMMDAWIAADKQYHKKKSIETETNIITSSPKYNTNKNHFTLLLNAGSIEWPDDKTMMLQVNLLMGIIIIIVIIIRILIRRRYNYTLYYNAEKSV